MNDDTLLTLHPSGDGAVYRGYHFTDDDIEKLIEFFALATTLDGAGLDVEINEIGVGCQEFTRRQLNDLYAQYRKLKAQPQGFTVMRGDRVIHHPSNTAYIVAESGHQKYQLISLKNGNRWDNDTVNHGSPKDPIPFVDFLTKPNDLINWRKC